MLYKRFFVTIVVNGQELEIFSQDDLNLRINNNIFNPEKIASSTSEYSFTFSVPKSAKNKKIFDYADNLSKVNKFNKKYNCIVYCDGVKIFEGSLRIASISQDEFKCNLISYKINNIEEIFGESKLNELEWFVPYVGVDTINNVNADMTTDYFFPLVSYGVFQKDPTTTDTNSINAYTSKYLLDKYVRWYDESFIPSHKLTTLIKKLFEAKGYDVDGNIFNDETVNNIYLSSHLKDGQSPNYNLGGDLGKCTVLFSWKNINRTADNAYSLFSPIETMLAFPYGVVGSSRYNKYNFDTVGVWDILQQAGSYSDGKFVTSNKFMCRDRSIIIPADGLYKISLDVDFSIKDAPSSMKGLQWVNVSDENKKLVTIEKSWANFPVEIQLLKNDSEMVELIYGFRDENRAPTVYPHEAPYSNLPKNPRDSINNTSGTGKKEYMAYVPKTAEFVAYDPWVNSNFICGVTSINNSPSVIKNGYSWNAEYSSKTNSRYNCDGYWGIKNPARGNYSWDKTDWNENTLNNAPANKVYDGNDFVKHGQVSCIVELKKNDVIMLKAIGKIIEQEESETRKLNYYDISASGTISIEAYSPNVAGNIGRDNLSWNDPTEFDKDLNLGGFLSEEVKQSDFVNNFIKAFNLDFRQDGNVCHFNTQNKNINTIMNHVNVDNKSLKETVETEPIEYPYSVEVKYSIDEEEAGFYDSVPADHINDYDWKDWADKGSDKIVYPLYEENDENSVSLTNSYTWYHHFTLVKYNSDGTETGRTELNLPIISKDVYMIDGYNYEESMKVDGRGLKQRWWFRQTPTTNSVFTTDGEEIFLTIPTNTMNGLDLSYKNEDGTLLTRFFNIIQYSNSNYITVEAYLNVNEYLMLKNGARLKYDDDIYIVCELSGYDPTGGNATKIKAMKKVS